MCVRGGGRVEQGGDGGVGRAEDRGGRVVRGEEVVAVFEEAKVEELVEGAGGGGGGDGGGGGGGGGEGGWFGKGVVVRARVEGAAVRGALEGGNLGGGVEGYAEVEADVGVLVLLGEGGEDGVAGRVRGRGVVVGGVRPAEGGGGGGRGGGAARVAWRWWGGGLGRRSVRGGWRRLAGVEDGLDDADDGRQDAAEVLRFGFGRRCLLEGHRQILVRPLRLELGNLALVLLDARPLALANRPLRLSVCVCMLSTTGTLV